MAKKKTRRNRSGESAALRKARTKLRQAERIYEKAHSRAYQASKGSSRAVARKAADSSGDARERLSRAREILEEVLRSEQSGEAHPGLGTSLAASWPSDAPLASDEQLDFLRANAPAQTLLRLYKSRRTQVSSSHRASRKVSDYVLGDINAVVQVMAERLGKRGTEKEIVEAFRASPVEPDPSSSNGFTHPYPRELTANPGRFFVVVDVDEPGGQWVGLTGRKIYERRDLEDADREAAIHRKKGRNVQVIDAEWYQPAREVLKWQGKIGNPEPNPRSRDTRREAEETLDALEREIADLSTRRGRTPVEENRLRWLLGHRSLWKKKLGRIILQQPNPTVPNPGTMGEATKRYDEDYDWLVVDTATRMVLSGWYYKEDAYDDLDERKESDPSAQLSVMTPSGVKERFGSVVWSPTVESQMEYLSQRLPMVGLNADWSVSAWHLGPGKPNTRSGDVYILEDEDLPPDRLDRFLVVRRWYEDDFDMFAPHEREEIEEMQGIKEYAGPLDAPSAIRMAEVIKAEHSPDPPKLRNPARIILQQPNPEEPRVEVGYQLEVEGEPREAKDLATLLREGIEKSADICAIAPPVCVENLGISRSFMPQFDDPATRFLQALSEDGGVAVIETKIPVGELKATQREINARKVLGMLEAFRAGDFPEIRDHIIVSNDDYILDGHHRWAALLVDDPANEMRVYKVDLPIWRLLVAANASPGVTSRGFADLKTNPSQGSRLTENPKDVWVVIGNYGKGSQTMWPSTDRPGAYSKLEALALARSMNLQPRHPIGGPADHLHWHAKPLSEAVRYAPMVPALQELESSLTAENE